MTNPWLVSLVTALATALLLAMVRWLLRRVRALRGPFSGQYLALTESATSGRILVEKVSCRQVGDHLAGSIDGLGILSQTDGRHFSANRGAYRFRGEVDQGVFLISYKTRIPALLSSGTLTLKADPTGRLLSGVWSGLIRGQLQSAACHWIRILPRKRGKKGRGQLLELAREYVAQQVEEARDHQEVTVPAKGGRGQPSPRSKATRRRNSRLAKKLASGAGSMERGMGKTDKGVGDGD